MTLKQKKDLTFAVFRLRGLSLVERIEMLAAFETWEQENLGAATTSEGRLTAWDDAQNGGRLAAIAQEHGCPAASSRPRQMASAG